jgi:S1-C subfamily serine protease
MGRDQKTDIALLRVKTDKPLKAVRFGDSDKLRLGEWVIAIGNPFSLAAVPSRYWRKRFATPANRNSRSSGYQFSFTVRQQRKTRLGHARTCEYS